MKNETWKDYWAKKENKKKDKEKNTGIKNIMKEPERLRQNEM